MAKSTFFQSSFVSGELSPLLKGRVDLDQYYQGVEIGSDVLIVPQGGLKRRYGTKFVSETVNTLSRKTNTPTMPNGGTAANINDNNPDTNATTNAIGTKGTPGGTPTEFVIAQYDLGGNPSELAFVDIQKIKTVTASTATCQLKLQYSTNNSDWLTAQEFTVSNIEKTFRKRVFLTKRYWRLARQNDTGDLGAQTINLTEFNLQTEAAAFSSEKSKLFNFAAESDRKYLCVLTPGNLRILKIVAVASTNETVATSYVADVIVPYLSASVPSVREAQTENVMLLFQEDYAPKRIINNGASNYDSFAIDDIPFINVPAFDYNDTQSPTPVDDVQVLTLTDTWKIGDTFQIDVEGVLSKNITYAGDVGTSAQNQQSSTEFNLQKNLQEMPVFGDTGVAVARTGAKQYTITISGESTKAFELFSGFPTSGTATKTLVFGSHVTGSPRKEDVWSGVYAANSANAGTAPGRGYPKMGTFYNGRLWLGGTKSKPQSLIASRAGTFFDFYTEEGDDDEGIFITISARTLTEIIDINPDRGLQVFCSGAEFVVEGDTPTSVEIKAQTQHGVADLEVKSVDGATLFIDQNGRSLRSYVFDYNEDAYKSTDISVLSSHLIKQPVDYDILQGTTSEDANWVFIINQDGTGTVLNTLRAQDINGFTSITPAKNIDNGNAAQLLSCTVVNGAMFQVAKRNTASGNACFVELWQENYLLDAAQVVSANTSITGLNHFEGNTLEVLGNTINSTENHLVTIGNKVVTNGAITLTTEEIAGLTSVQAGLPFVPTIKPMPLNTNAGPGQNQMKDKKIVNMNLRIYKSGSLSIDGNDIAFRNFIPNPLARGITAFSGVISNRNGGNGWDIDVVPVITCPDSQPFHIQAIEYEVSSS